MVDKEGVTGVSKILEEKAKGQYSAGSKTQVEERSASVIT
jgi:hypothetical protein